MCHGPPVDTEAFVNWALSGERTLEERYTTELVVEKGVDRWNSQRGVFNVHKFDQMRERQRQRALNPAYEPQFSEESVRRAAEGLALIKEWSEFCSHDDRPVRDMAVFGFLTNLESVSLHHCEVADVSPLARLPRLRSLHFSSTACRDLRPLARCTGLRDLQLKLMRHWPDVSGVADLPEVESLLLEGNLLVFERAVWRKVRFAVLRCSPLEARNVRDLPQLPACEFLSLGGIESLEGIEAFSQLRNLTIESGPESFEPLAGLKHLTCLTAKEHEPIEVTPLSRVPGLQYVCFNTWNKHRLRPVKPRDLAPLVEAPVLRELQVVGNPLLETEAAAIQAGLPGWGDLHLLPEPRPLPPWRLLAWPAAKIPQDLAVNRLPDEPEQIDLGLRRRELRWAGDFLRRAIDRKLGTSDWSDFEGREDHHQDYHPHIVSPTNRSLYVEFHSYGLLEKMPLAVEAIRETISRLRGDYRVLFQVSLKVPRLKRSAAQIKLEEKFQREQEEEEWERERKEREDYLERLHRYELLKQEGRKIDPDDFAPDGSQPLPASSEDEEDEDENDGADDDGEVAVKEKPDPPPMLDDGEHPLAMQYYLLATITLGECYVFVGRRSLAEYLFQRPCDEVIEEEKNP